MYGPYSSSLADSRPFLDVESLLHNLAQDFVTAFNTGNYDQAAALFVSDGAFMVPHQEPAYGPRLWSGYCASWVKVAIKTSGWKLYASSRRAVTWPWRSAASQSLFAKAMARSSRIVAST